MSRRPVTEATPEENGRNASAAIARAQLLDVDADRPKRIDQYLDYFGESGLPRRGEIREVGEAEPREV